MWRRLRSAAAALGSNCSGACGGKELQESIGKSAGEMALYLRGERYPLARMTFPPRRQLQ
jgi:hypothetical protein